MKVKKMVFNQKFISQLKKLPPQIGEKVLEKLHIFEENPFHPSLRLHKLS
jgi:mRNA-degrading endonuclease RelE of RelBE toxin-antitoxin system